MFRTLRVEFATLDDFRREYQRNMANGGMFVPTEEEFEPREVIELELELAFCDKLLPLQSEVVSRIDRTLQDPDRLPGVAIQFLEPIDELRCALAEMAGIAPAQAPDASPGWLRRDGPTRAHDRTAVRAALTLRFADDVRKGQTRNLSRSGAFITISGGPPSTGQAVEIELEHPTTGEKRTIDARVVRNASYEGDRSGVALEFSFTPQNEADSTRFVEHICHALGAGSEAISGPIGGLGLPNLLQMFSSSADEGTLYVFRGVIRAEIVFAGGGLQHAAVGNARGLKALSRILGWDEGHFEFYPVADSESGADDPIPMYGAVLEALQFVDELRRLDLSAYPPTAVVSTTDVPAPDDLEALPAAVLERAAQALPIHELLDARPEFDAQVYEAIILLAANGLVDVDDA